MRITENFEFDISNDELKSRFYSTANLIKCLQQLQVLQLEELSGQEFGNEGWLVVRYKDG